MKIKDITKDGLFSDGDWIESKDQDPKGEVRLIQLADIGDGYFINKSNRFMNIETAKRLKCTFLKKDDILIARMPDPVGRCCLFPLEGDHKYVTVVDVCILRIGKSVNRKYLKYGLNNPIVRNRINEQITGTTRKRITKKKLGELKIPLPPLAEQKRIAKILDQADQLRQLNQQILAEYDALTKSLFLDMFGDPVVNPMGWKFCELKTLLSSKSQNGHYVPKKDYIETGVEMIHMSDAFNQVVTPGKLKRAQINTKELEKYELLSTDILLARRSLNYEGAAKPCLIPEYDEPLIYESSLIRIRPNLSMVNTLFLFYYFNNKRARSKYIFKYVTKSTISGINNKGLNLIEVYVPPINLQNKFAQKIKNIEAQKAKAQAALAASEDLFNNLLQKAFKGEL